jgi:hypothetical protein
MGETGMIVILIGILAAILLVGAFIMGIFVHAHTIKEQIVFIQEDVETMRRLMEATAEPLLKDVETMTDILESTEPAQETQNLSEVGLDSPVRFL